MKADELSASVLSYLCTAPTSEFNGQRIEIQDAWHGNDNLLWRVAADNGDAVLKLYLDAGQARSRRQFDGQQSFAPLGIAPRPLWYDRYPVGLARQVMVYEWVEGEAVNPDKIEQLIALARAVAQLHSGDAANVRRFSPNPVNLDYLWRIMQGSMMPTKRWLHERSQPLYTLFDQIVEHTQALVEGALPRWQNAPAAPVHGDLKLENCLYSGGTAILLDWEMYGLGDAALDAAHFLYWNRNGLTEDKRKAWQETYLSMVEQPLLAQRMGVYAQVLPVQTLCYLLDGLRKLPADLPDAGTVLPFLQETLSASIEETVSVLSMHDASPAQVVANLFETLV